jgi:hypothetical protein
MPICPNCRIAYLDGEAHRCTRRTSVGGAVAGTLAGAVIGFLLATVGYGTITGSNLSCVVGLFVGAPLGGLVGAVVGSRSDPGEQ